MIYNTLPKLSYKNNINQTQIIINKIKKIGKNGHCRESSEFFGQKPFLFGKNYYWCKLYDYD